MSNYEELLEFLKPFAEGSDGFLGFTKADRSQDPEDNKKWGAFVNWYAECGNGDVDLPIDVLSEDPKWEYYFTPAVLTEKSRLQSKFSHSNVVWIDFDEPVDWQSFDPAPSIVVQTSEHKFHCYWLLTWRITDANDMRYWCKRFLTHFDGGDQSGFDATQLLKLPWGLNLKLGSKNEDGTPWAPKIIKFEPEIRYNEAAFAEMPEPEVNLDVSVDMSALPDLPEVENGWRFYLDEFAQEIPAKLRKKVMEPLDGGEEKRSGALYNIVCELYDALGNVEDVYRVLLGSPNDKFTADHGTRGASLLWKDVNRVAAKKQAAKATPKKVQGIRDIQEDKALSGRDKTIESTTFIMNDLLKTGDFVQTDKGEAFYMDRRTGSVQLHNVDTETTAPFCGLIRHRYELNQGADRALITGVSHEAITACQQSEPVRFHNFSHYDLFRNLVYVDRYDGHMYVLDGETVKLQPHGYDDVYFYQATSSFPKPFEYSSDYTAGALDALILDGPNYTTQGNKVSRKEIRHILKTWVASFFFPEKMDTKPIVLIHGPADSGKTTLFQNLSIVFTGDSTYSVTDIPKDTREFNVQVTQSPYVFYDNVEVNKREMQEKLAQVATGYTVKMRKLFTTNDMVSIKARSFVGITSRTLDKIQDDVASRYITVPVHPFDTGGTNRRSMSDILTEVTAKRDELWSEIIDFVNQMVGQISAHGVSQPNTKLRMADYGALLEITSGLVGLSPTKLENFVLQQQTAIVSENDQLFNSLLLLIEAPSHNPEHKYNSKELHTVLCRLNRRMLNQYSTPNKMTRALNGFINGGQFERAGIKVLLSRSGNNATYSVGRAV